MESVYCKNESSGVPDEEFLRRMARGDWPTYQPDGDFAFLLIDERLYLSYGSHLELAVRSLLSQDEFTGLEVQAPDWSTQIALMNELVARRLHTIRAAGRFSLRGHVTRWYSDRLMIHTRPEFKPEIERLVREFLERFTRPEGHGADQEIHATHQESA